MSINTDIDLYFMHKYNARNDTQMLKIRMKHGFEGYAIVFMLLEHMRASNDYGIKENDIDTVAFEIGANIETIKDIIYNFDYFFVDNGIIYNSLLLDNMEYKEKVRKQKSDAGKKGAEMRWNRENDSTAIAQPKQNDSTVITEDSNKIKRNEIKSNNNKSNNNKSNDSVAPKVADFPIDSQEYFLSEYLYKKILENDSKFKKPNLQTWSKDMDKLMRIDKRDFMEIKNVIDFSTNNDFWKSNILSVKKLREKFSQLLQQSLSAVNKNSKKQEQYNAITEFLNE